MDRLEQAEFDEVFTVIASAIAQVDAAAPADLTSAEAVADITIISIRVADFQLPGTSGNFNDFLAIEFGEGYPTQVVQMTWGHVKSLYNC